MSNKAKIAVLVTATIVPGGFLALGAYYLYKRLKKKEEPEEKPLVDVERWKREK